MMNMFAATRSLTVSVVVPTFKRPDSLRLCLEGIASQERSPDEVVVVVRDSDEATRELLESMDREALRLRIATVTVPGQVQALNRALHVVTCDIIAITDDDAVPHKDWIARIERHFLERRDVAGVGGRDYLHVNKELVVGRSRVVGKIRPYRSHIGNHHLGFGEAREVDILKGVNGAYRTNVLREIGFDERLRGTGAQVHWEMSLDLAIKRRGWKLLYDPSVAVDHFLAPRFDEDQRESFNEVAQRNMAYNEALIRLEHLDARGRLLFFTWSLALGTRALPGVIQLFRFLPKNRARAWHKFRSTLQGRIDAWRYVAAGS